MQKIKTRAYWCYAYTNSYPTKEWYGIWYLEEPGRFKITRLVCKE